MIHRPTGGYHQRNCVFCLWIIITEMFVWGLKFTKRQLDQKNFEVDKWVLLEIPTGQ